MVKQIIQGLVSNTSAEKTENIENATVSSK